MPLNAESVTDSFLGIFTNSSIMVWFSTLLIVLFCRAAAGKVSLVPAGFQNFAEWLIEGLYNFFGSLLGDHLVKKTFWFFGGTFLFILVNNWLALMPVLEPWVGILSTMVVEATIFLCSAAATPTST